MIERYTEGAKRALAKKKRLNLNIIMWELSICC